MSRPDLDAGDRVTEAINLILLIQLGAASIQSDDGSAIAQGCASALEKLDAAEALLAQLRPHAST